MWASVKNEDCKESSEFEFVKMALNVTCDIVTFWEQKFQKLQNENNCLTYLNVANKGNFPILGFGRHD
jgi:hypothetical protein